VAGKEWIAHPVYHARYPPEDWPALICEHLRPVIETLEELHDIHPVNIFEENIKAPTATISVSAPLPMASLRETLRVEWPLALKDDAVVCHEHWTLIAYDPSPWAPAPAIPENARRLARNAPPFAAAFFSLAADLGLLFLASSGPPRHVERNLVVLALLGLSVVLLCAWTNPWEAAKGQESRALRGNNQPAPDPDRQVSGAWDWLFFAGLWLFLGALLALALALRR
jgi:hypothetical protein